MPKIVQVKVDVESGEVELAVDRTETLIRQLRDLKYSQQQLDTSTREGAAAFAEMNVKILELNEQLEVNKVRNKNIFDQVGMLGGAFGETGAKVGEAVSSLRILSSFRLEDLTSGLKFVGSTIESIATGFGKVTGITKLYTALNGYLAESFVAVGVAEEAAATGASVLAGALIATGIGALVVGLVLAYDALKEFVTGEEAAKVATEEANKAIADQAELLNLDLADAARRQKKNLADLKAGGADEKTIREEGVKNIKENLKIVQGALSENSDIQNKIMKDGNGDLKKAQEEGLKLEQKAKDLKAEIYAAEKNNIADNNKEVAKLAKEKADKAKAATDKEIAERKRIKDEIGKAETEGYLATLSKQEQEEYKVNQHYATLLADATKHKVNTEGIETARLQALEKIRADYKVKETEAFEKKLKEDLDKLDKANKEKEDLEIAHLENEHAKGEMSEIVYQEKLYQIKLKYAKNEKERLDAETAKIKSKDTLKNLQDDAAVLAAREKILLKGTLTYLQNAKAIEDNAFKQKRIKDKDNNALLEADKKEHDRIMSQLDREYAQMTMEATAQFFQNLATIFGKNKEIAKVAIRVKEATTIGTVVMNDLAAIRDAYSASPLTFGLPWSAFYLADMAVGVLGATSTANDAISAIDNPTGGSSAAGAGSAAQAATPSFNGSVSVPAPQIGASAASSTGNLGSIVGNAVQSGNSTSRPIQAFVVGTSVTTQQQLDRRIALAARMGG